MPSQDRSAKVVIQVRFTDRGQLTRAGVAAELAKLTATERWGTRFAEPEVTTTEEHMLPRLAGVPFGPHFEKWQRDRGIADERMARLLGVHVRTVLRLHQTLEDSDETRQIEDKLRELQKREPATANREQARAVWERLRLQEIADAS